jgi:hypothetical protein
VIQVRSVNVRGFSRTYPEERTKCRSFSGWAWANGGRSSPIRIHQSGVLAPNPLSWIFCSPLPTSTSLRIPVRVRHHNYLSQRITLVRSKVRTGKDSRTALLQYSDRLELASPPSTSPSLLNPMTSTCIFRSFRDTHTNWRMQHRSVRITRPFLPSARYK